MHKLVKPRLVLAAHIALSNQGGVGGKDHTLTDTPIPFPANLAVVKL